MALQRLRNLISSIVITGSIKTHTLYPMIDVGASMPLMKIKQAKNTVASMQRIPATFPKAMNAIPGALKISIAGFVAVLISAPM